MSSVPSPKSTTTSSGNARLRIVVDQESYSYGYVKVVGTVENIGESGAYSPSLKIRVTKGGTLLAEDTTWPAGTRLKTLNPGDKVAFESMTRVPGEPPSAGLTYELVASGFPYEIQYPKR
jgi:hypothetical protein